ncbi:hypothetical protein OIO90_002595 [Microbotryomycetes sp. JL221]|nr:hypothetical protein OIO90_002595 [Microbotryomycetes sp. JL221]
MAPLIQFKAGQCFRQGDTNTVVPSPGRGLITIENEDGLLHFRYKDLEAGAVTEDLILFEGDASFIKASERVHCLKFSSSSARSFYWHQDVDSSNDEANARRVNELIGGTVEEESASMDLEGATVNPFETPAPTARTTTSTTATTTTTTTTTTSKNSASQPIVSTTASSSGNAALGSNEQMAQLQDILAGLRSQAGQAVRQRPSFVLPDVLPPSVMQTILYSDPTMYQRLLPFIPSELPQTQESVARALTSPEFQRGLSSLDRALRTGATGPLMRGLGLNESAAEGVEQFLEQVQKKADEEKRKEEEGQQQQTGSDMNQVDDENMTTD